jgi:putative nucleotidyltransferase with HDIG domain
MTGQPPCTPCQVLLVDDEENILRAIARLLLEESDLEVLCAGSGAQGLEILAAHPGVALVLSDQRMPGMSGAEFLQKARELAPDAVRMVLTGYADMSATMDAINKGGASRYLLKPWDDEMLRRTLREGVDQYRLLQENRRLNALVERQNAELSEWNGSLKSRVMQQTATIRQQNEALRGRNQQVTRAFAQTIVAFSRLIEQYSSRLQEHTANVTALSTAVAGELGLAPDQVETVRTAALLHDIGVIGIPLEILGKPESALSEAERDIFLQHAVRGQSAVDEVEELREAGVLIRHHHERYAGDGFPDRLAGAAIPLGSRIIACADYLDRELAGRRGEAAVRRALDKAAGELGRLLDPALLPVMEPHFRRHYLPAHDRRQEDADRGADHLVEKELRPKQLIEGMLVTRTVTSGSGQVILTGGTVLDTHQIASVLRHYRIDPPRGGIHVSWQPAQAAPGTGPGQLEEMRLKLGHREPGAGGADRRAPSLELMPKQLTEGMRTTRKIYSGTGLLLLTEGTLLDASTIARLIRYYEIDPPAGGVCVVKKEARP